MNPWKYKKRMESLRASGERTAKPQDVAKQGLTDQIPRRRRRGRRISRAASGSSVIKAKGQGRQL